jgi:hypothetical protein
MRERVIVALCPYGVPFDADGERPARKGLLAAKGLPKIGEPMIDQKPTADELAGMAWWNALAEDQRAYWLSEADTAIRRRADQLPAARTFFGRGRA